MISHTFHTDELCIGGSIESLLYSYITEIPLIIDKPRRPAEIDQIHSDMDLSFLGFRNEEVVSSLWLWERLSFLLSMGGLLLFPNSIESIRPHANKLTVVTHNMRRVDVTYNKLRRLDTKLTNYTWIYDWFAIRSGGRHEIDLLEDKNSLVSKLVFYPSKRIGVRGTKDVVAISFVKSSEILDMENSEGYVTLKSRKMMNAAGIRGTSKGITHSGARRYSPIRIEHLHREFREQLIPDMTLQQILDLPRNTKGALCKMTKNLFRRQLLSI